MVAKKNGVLTKPIVIRIRGLQEDEAISHLREFIDEHPEKNKNMFLVHKMDLAAL